MTKWAHVVFLGLLACALPVHAGTVIVVTQEDTPVTTLSQDEVADLFLGKRDLIINGLTLTPLDVNDDSLRETFYQGVAGMSVMRVNAYWARMVFTSQGRPPKKIPLSEVIKLVRSRSGLVSYLPSNDGNGFKILLKVQ